MIKRMEAIKEQLLSQVEGQMGNLKETDTEEFHWVIEAIESLSEAIYYCTITKAMEEGEETDWGKKETHGGTYYYSPKMTPRYSIDAPVEYMDPRYRENYLYPKYAGGNGGNGGMSSNNGGGSRYHHPMGEEYPYYPMRRDPYEGKSPDSRKRYMEGKEKHMDKTKQMQELEEYMKELSEDITEMIEDATMEEKQLLQSKINTLASKIK